MLRDVCIGHEWAASILQDFVSMFTAREEKPSDFWVLLPDAFNVRSLVFDQVLMAEAVSMWTEAQRLTRCGAM
ncbi:hypothetical protein [Deinococcus yavapaiensis]|uniref:hypothetical protein n=1 Tax=Deinococcus yavapaiensis TaxID=309889 RepID=UPI0011B5E518|nr:hypothetical protein [Deinococcus yavapaiensis]